MTISINHPTNRPNLTEVHVGTLTIWFSYRTPIAFRDGFDAPPTVRQNDWNVTTGRHLNWIDNGDKSSRIDGETFTRLLGAAANRQSEPIPVLG